jgi:hypothetical protein
MTEPTGQPPRDEQDRAEQVDEEVLGGAEVGEDDADPAREPGFPPDRPLGVESRGVTPAEAEGGESLEERADQEEPDVVDDAD